MYHLDNNLFLYVLCIDITIIYTIYIIETCPLFETVLPYL